jgi:hypothetical protein
MVTKVEYISLYINTMISRMVWLEVDFVIFTLSSFLAEKMSRGLSKSFHACMAAYKGRFQNLSSTYSQSTAYI